MKIDYKEIWNELKECLNSEESTLYKVLAKAPKSKEYLECIEYKNELATIIWLNGVIEHLEETGDLP